MKANAEPRLLPSFFSSGGSPLHKVLSLQDEQMQMLVHLVFQKRSSRPLGERTSGVGGSSFLLLGDGRSKSRGNFRFNVVVPESRGRCGGGREAFLVVSFPFE